jgi:hypothetical protein
MQCGIFNMTRKQNGRASSGKHRIHLSWKSMHVFLTVYDHTCVLVLPQRASLLWIHCTRTNIESAVLFGNADKFTVIYLQERTWTLAWLVDFPPRQCPCAWCVKFLEFLAKKSITEMDHPPYSPD